MYIHIIVVLRVELLRNIIISCMNFDFTIDPTKFSIDRKTIYSTYFVFVVKKASLYKNAVCLIFHLKRTVKVWYT